LRQIADGYQFEKGTIMGLDMYLEARKFVSGYDFAPEADKHLFNQLSEISPAAPSVDSPSFQLTVNIGYWRKANAIHGWFVREIGDGVDECQEMYVRREKLAELKSALLLALGEKPSVVAPASQGYSINGNPAEVIAETMVLEAHRAELNDESDTDPLRPVGGFFFGGTEKDEWYYRQLANTLDIIEKALALPSTWDIYYQASW